VCAAAFLSLAGGVVFALNRSRQNKIDYYSPHSEAVTFGEVFYEHIEPSEIFWGWGEALQRFDMEHELPDILSAIEFVPVDTKEGVKIDARVTGKDKYILVLMDSYANNSLPNKFQNIKAYRPYKLSLFFYRDGLYAIVKGAIPRKLLTEGSKSKSVIMVDAVYRCENADTDALLELIEEAKEEHDSMLR